jgi:hypothetical protein
VSTADVLRFADGAKFFAALGQASVLTVAKPVAFGFLGNTPGSITIRGSTLRVPAGQALSVVGGDLEIAGQSRLSVGIGGEFDEARVPTLGAPSGRISLASVAASGEVHFTPLALAMAAGDCRDERRREPEGPHRCPKGLRYVYAIHALSKGVPLS